MYNDNISPEMQNLIRQAQQNPRMLEDLLRQNNPQALEKAISIRNSQNPKATIFKMAQQQGLPPVVLKMLGLM